ncbi:MAG TPA: glycosyltransferase family 92 protein [Kiritimatiellia bacterium]|nr:glycosyltransferase family 92 protein [Kiritimatiellia bacterium]
MAQIRNLRSNFPYELSVCAIFKNEADYLDEWLAFHTGIGVDHFFLYNDQSVNDYKRVLAPWMKDGKITLVDWPGHGQVKAYNHCLQSMRNRSRWLAFIDIDEFLFSPAKQDIREALDSFRNESAIFVYWLLFGSSGHKTRPSAPVLEAYTRCMDRESAVRDNFNHRFEGGLEHYVTGWAQDGKSIVNPRLVRWQNVHQPGELWTGRLVDENRRIPARRGATPPTLSISTLRINHYWSKSLEEFAVKIGKGDVFDPSRPPRVLEDWLKREAMLNISEDKTILERRRLPANKGATNESSIVIV